MDTALIQVSGLRKQFQMGQVTVHALAGVDMQVEGGSFNIVMGPSGSGKSTLLYLLGGLDRPTAGQVRVGGQLLDDLDENELARYRRRTVGFIFQSFSLVPSMTALDNVVFPMRFVRGANGARKASALELLHRVGLETRAYHRPSELSGGEQQRVAIARALVNDPRLVLADEPTGNLDTASGHGILEVLADLYREGRTIVMVTHDDRFTKYATQMLHLLDGRIV